MRDAAGNESLTTTARTSFVKTAAGPVDAANPVLTALTLPETAVTYTAYGETVFVAQQSAGQALSVQRIAVTTGARQGGRVQIVSGLSAGDRVVTSGQLKLVDGMAVEAVTDTLEERT